MLHSLKASAKTAAFAVCPDIALRLFSIRSRRMIERQVRELGLDNVARNVARRTDNKVAKGPFAGMRLDYEALPVHSAPKFLGTYEQELDEHVERVISLNPPSVLNVGCAEGFYSVGFGLRLPRAQIYAADADPKAIRATLRNAKLNGLTNLCSIGIVAPGTLGKFLTKGSLLVIDCEGAEFSLLDPSIDPILRDTHIIVEVHHDAGQPKDIRQRFATTHKSALIVPTPRTPGDLQVTGIELSAADERAGEKSWLYLEALPSGISGKSRH